MNTKYTFKIVAYQSKAYEQTIALRDTILRRPLGMVFTPEQLAEEHNQIHIACFDKNELVGCLVLKLCDDNKVKMRQVAVAANRQKQGIGQAMIYFSEDWAHSQGKTIMYCHARDTAVPFYEKLGYEKVGKPFEEVSIKHFYMEKKIL